MELEGGGGEEEGRKVPGFGPTACGERLGIGGSERHYRNGDVNQPTIAVHDGANPRRIATLWGACEGAAPRLLFSSLQPCSPNLS